jgi:hypothetical protein
LTEVPFSSANRYALTASFSFQNQTSEITPIHN